MPYGGWRGVICRESPSVIYCFFFFPFSFSRNSLQLQTHAQSPHVAASLVNHNQQFSRENRRKATVWVPAGGIGLGRRGTSRLKGRRTGKCHKQRLLDESARRSRRNISEDINVTSQSHSDVVFPANLPSLCELRGDKHGILFGSHCSFESTVFAAGYSLFISDAKT